MKTWMLAAALWPFASLAAPAFELVNPGPQAAVDEPHTLGHVFAPGEIPSGKTLSAVESAGATLRLQVDRKATHADGSLRHAVITVIASLPAGGSRRVGLAPAAPPAPGPQLSAAELLATAYDLEVALVLGGKTYAASARAALAAAGPSPKTWLSGPMATEWLVRAPLVAAPSDTHPHLQARFAIRAHAGLEAVRTDLTVENGWAFEPSPSGFTYDVTVESEGRTAYSKAGLAHTHHARWRKVFWWGKAPSLDSRLDPAYLRSTRAVPWYDPALKPPEPALAGLAAAFDPMSNGDLTSYMPATGAHPDIGPLPRSAALYLLGTDPRAKANVVANGAAGGSFQVHYRDKVRDLPVSIDDYPYMTLLGNPGDTRNPATGKSESFPAVTGGLEKHVPDDAHQPSIAYLPYLLTGDHFFLEELHFWAHWNLIQANPGYREREKGLLKWAQVRGQAWALRTLGHAAYLTPDDHPHKASFAAKLRNNLAWYTAHTAGNPDANALGWLDVDYARAYSPNGIAPWQDDFFTWTVAHLVDLGFAEARELARWKARFVLGRLGDPGFCWLKATAYSLQVGPADKSSLYATFGALYQANFPAATCNGASMEGYPDSPEGYGANMQPALAAAVDLGMPGAAAAWARFQARNPRPDYAPMPQWAVVPRDSSGTEIATQLPFRAPAPRLRVRFEEGGLVLEQGDRRFSLSGRRWMRR